MNIKDSLTGALKPVPITPGVPISIYACGITPYSPAHIGHARTYAVFDLLAKALASEGHAVRLARNITDIDDKILAAASAAGVGWREISAKYAEENRGLMRATGLPVPEEPQASEHLPDMFWLIERLMEKGLAYISGSGDALYRVTAYAGAQLMPHKEGALRSEAGAGRVSGAGKEDPRDFALWKRAPRSEPGFDSPWGWGRPGWHIECSAMIRALFGGSVAIHGGGVDLKFPHHQAEIMQSEPVFGRPLAGIWMHNGSVLSAGRKMSKSEGNFVTWQAGLDAAEALAPGLGGELLRFALLQAHWQKPLDWSETLLASAHADLLLLSSGLSEAPDSGPAEPPPALARILGENLNAPAAFTWLREQLRDGQSEALAQGLRYLGISASRWAALPREAPVTLSEAGIEELQAQRRQARASRDWARADELRKQLLSHGVPVQDAPTAKAAA